HPAPRLHALAPAHRVPVERAVRVRRGPARPPRGPAFDRKGADPLPAGRAGWAPPPRLASLVDPKGAGPLPAGRAGWAPPPRLASLVDPKGAGPLPAGRAGWAPPPRLASLVDRRGHRRGGAARRDAGDARQRRRHRRGRRTLA